MDSRLFSDIIAAQFDDETSTCRPEHQGGQPKPLHLHANASSRTYRYGDASQSCIYRVHHEEFRTMIREEPTTIEAIFAERHILVYGCKTDHDWAWCSRSLEQLGFLQRPLEVEGLCLSYYGAVMK